VELVGTNVERGFIDFAIVDDAAKRGPGAARRG